MAVAGAAIGLAGCATTEPPGPAAPGGATMTKAAVEKPAVDRQALGEEARAHLAQAETDIQRARARRALWAKAWEALVGARESLAANDHAGAIRLARRASELARLGLEQLAYPAVKQSTLVGEQADHRRRSTP